MSARSLSVHASGFEAPHPVSTPGRPIVASTVGGLPELVSDGRNGFLCDRGNADEFGEKLARLLKDPGLAQQLGSRGAQRLDELGDRDSHADRLVGMYGDVLAR